jgi:hypothetical protein
MAEIGQLTERRLSLAAAAAERRKSGHRPPWMAYQAIDIIDSQLCSETLLPSSTQVLKV